MIRPCSALLLLAACLQAADTPKDQVRGGFTVATYNILYKNVDLPRLVGVIKEAKADLVALQETNAESEKFLRRQLGDVYPHMMFREGGRAAGGFGFLSRSALKNSKFLDPLPGGCGAWLVEVQLGGTNVQIVSVHLATPKTAKLSTILGAVQMFQDVEEIHAKEITRIHGAMNQQMPAIVLGDFNSLSMFHPPKFLSQRGFTDSFASVTEKPDDHPTCHYPVRGTDFKFRIDYIFHTGQMRTGESRIVPSDASDHSMVVSRLEWKE
ncbi:MAG TPA: endonuclease/exonuclease/phosphatase family protein [Verrucomicrobiae bacterium]|jgi:endonuclease/exonuclease/phosphatase family metal-dependent hydrolase